MQQPTPNPTLVAQVADELEDCRQRGLDRLDQPLGRSRKRIAAPEVSRLASAYCTALGLRLGGHIQEIRRLLTDSLMVYGEHDKWAAGLLRILYFGTGHSRRHRAAITWARLYESSWAAILKSSPATMTTTDFLTTGTTCCSRRSRLS